MSPLTILISGKQGSGKTSTTDLVEQKLRRQGVRVYRYRFAQPIYEMHNAIYTIGKEYGITLKGAKDGELLQWIGTEWGRNKMGKNVWVNAAKAYIAKTSNSIDALVAFRTVFIIDDLRFENEFDEFPEGFKVRLECPEEIRKARASYWRENTQHESEIGLDNYAALGKFDMLLNSADYSLDLVSTIVSTEIYRRLGIGD